MVTGTVRVRDWDNGERSGTSVEVHAQHIGHDYAYGTGTFVRTVLDAPDLPESMPYEY